MIKELSTENLLEAYMKALELNLEKEFIQMLKIELRNRSIIIIDGDNDY
ncbi:hypothetical protein CIL03_08400 [Virgibacillus indicus]|uniref:Sporulation histidine kinase inhibitor Sda n=1 Tax=Virgibacillus indicus TaxID=2024554 RepID=A0A265NAH9_9BACI|nr:sporulation histidine kinase inhibitor Sda [Virgibacillus indicus]OZU89028.1 hypothetical protein CIL03_08400 [Virgibacillus indicus]